MAASAAMAMTRRCWRAEVVEMTCCMVSSFEQKVRRHAALKNQCAVQPPSIGSTAPVIDAASRAAEKAHERGDFFDGDELARRLRGEQDVAHDLVFADAARARRVWDLLLHQRRQHVAGADGVAGDVLLGHFEGDGLGQAGDAVLGRDIGADLNGEATSACAEATLTMRPKPWRFIAGSAWRMVWNAAVRLMARIASHFAAGNSSIGATCWMPALLTRMSMRPKRWIVLLEHALDGVGARHVGAVVGHLHAVLRGQALACVFDLLCRAEAVQDDMRAGGGQRLGDAQSNAAGGAGDQRKLALKGVRR